MLLNPHRREERDTLLHGISAWLSRDGRIAAAWLFGSLGRGTADDFSDIDLWIIVDDDAIEAVVESREAFVAQFEAPILVIDAPQNAPPGGGYLLTLFSRSSGEQQVDWYWQRKSDAAVAGDVRMLFEREETARAAPFVAPGESAPQLDSQQLESVAKKINFFWAMLPITAKKIARGQLWDALRMTMMLRNGVAEVAGMLDAEQRCAAALALPPPHQPSEWAELLTQLAGAMERLMSLAGSRGAAMPTTLVPLVHLTLDSLLVTCRE